jgi:cytochrome c oxidase assembly protein subunit 11
MRDRRKNGRTALTVVGVICGMLALTFASVPLYRVICQVTGLAGTPSIEVGATAPGSQMDKVLTVRFDANVNPSLPWRFVPVQKEVKIHAGESALAFFEAENLTKEPIVGQATFNVTPFKAAPFFVKTACFCLSEQTLQPGQTVSMPVQFYVDPEMLKDANASDVETITLSYTFFRAKDEAQKLQSASDGGPNG